MRSLSRWQAVVLGLTTFLGLSLAATGLFAVGSRQWLWHESFTVQSGFQQIRGVEVGTRVRVQGIDAGEVVAIDAPSQPGENVSMRMRIDARMRPLLRADAVVRILNEGMVGGKVVEIDPGTGAAEPVADGAALASRPTVEWTDSAERLGQEAQRAFQEASAGMKQVNQTLQQVRDGEGVVGKELLQSIQQFRGTMASVQRDADAVQNLPLLGGYVKDSNQRLIRPDFDRQRRTFREDELFEAGQAVLSTEGRQKLDEVAGWLNEARVKGSEVVVVAYADRTWNADRARIVTQKQSETVCEYLKNQHGVHKTGWFGRRGLVPLGCGLENPPIPEKENLPFPRVEVVLYLPPG